MRFLTQALGVSLCGAGIDLWTLAVHLALGLIISGLGFIGLPVPAA